MTITSLRGRHAILTGATGGLGQCIAAHLADRGVLLSLVARSPQALARLQASLPTPSGQTFIMPTDLTQPQQRAAMVDAARQALGPIDVLINNAAVERSARLESVPPDELEQTIALNLTAVLALSQLVLPEMIERQQGHIVNISSLAGLGPLAFGESYGATKHGVVGFTRALRASLQCQQHAVSASVICPGMIRGAGMFAKKSADHGLKAPWILGTSAPQQVADAVERAITRDLPDVIVGRPFTRLMVAMGVLFPRLSEAAARWLRIHEPAHQAALAERLTQRSEPPP